MIGYKGFSIAGYNKTTKVEIKLQPGKLKGENVMKTGFAFIFAVGTAFGIQAAAFAEQPAAASRAEVNYINSSCAKDARTTGCEGFAAGSGLFKCMNNYKAKHKTFQLSNRCDAALKELSPGKRSGM